MNKLRTGDEVIVISGKDKGKTGTLTKIKGDRCLVTGIKLVKKHVKPNPQINEPGGIIEKESFINISNIAFYNTSTKSTSHLLSRHFLNHIALFLHYFSKTCCVCYCICFLTMSRYFTLF